MKSNFDGLPQEVLAAMKKNPVETFGPFVVDSLKAVKPVGSTAGRTAHKVYEYYAPADRIILEDSWWFENKSLKGKNAQVKVVEAIRKPVTLVIPGTNQEITVNVITGLRCVGHAETGGGNGHQVVTAWANGELFFKAREYDF